MLSNSLAMPTSPDESDHEDDTAIDAVFPADNGAISPKTPARSIRLSYGSPSACSKVRKAHHHATPPTAGRERPPKRVSDSALGISTAGSVPTFDPVATAPRNSAAECPAPLIDPSPRDVIDTGLLIDDAATTIVAPPTRSGNKRSVRPAKTKTKVATKAKSTAKKTKPAPKQNKNAANNKSTVETNRNKCSNNDIFPWARTIFSTDEEDGRQPMDIDDFKQWSDKQDELIRLRFKAMRQSKKQKEDSLGLGQDLCLPQ